MTQNEQPPYRQIILDPADEPLRGSWGALLALGLALAVLGILAFATSFATTMISMMVLGLVILGAAALQFTYAVMGRSWQGLVIHVGLAILYLVAGVMFVVQPELAAESLTMFLGVFLMVSGVFRIIGAFNVKFTGWGWGLVGGLVSLMLGGVVLAAWPLTSLFLIGMMVGVDLFFLGSYLTIYAFAIHREHAPVHPRVSSPLYS